MVDLHPRPGNDVFDGGAGAFAWVAARAVDVDAFNVQVEGVLTSEGFDVVSIDPPRRWDDFTAEAFPSREFAEAAARAGEAGAVAWGRYYVYETEDDDEPGA
jgi:hypothetical protein